MKYLKYFESENTVSYHHKMLLNYFPKLKEMLHVLGITIFYNVTVQQNHEDKLITTFHINYDLNFIPYSITNIVVKELLIEKNYRQIPMFFLKPL